MDPTDFNQAGNILQIHLSEIVREDKEEEEASSAAAVLSAPCGDVTDAVVVKGDVHGGTVDGTSVG